MYRIGELASLCQVNTDTLRFYEKQGLLKPSHRSQSGYRCYSRQELAQLRFILRAKSVGFTLAEIKKLLSINHNRSAKLCTDVKHFVDEKLISIDTRIAELTQFKKSLQKLSSACQGGLNSADNCSILESLAEELAGNENDTGR